MKRAQFAPGFPELRGNVSGKQNLEYPTDNQGAYEGPLGSVNYARNYKAAVVVSQRAKDGKFYYSIRKRTANHLTAKSKKAMSLLGGAGAIYAALLKTPALKTQAEAVWAKAQELGDKRSFREFMMWYIRQGLINHVATITLTIAGSTVSIENPWGQMVNPLNITISQDVRVKFWPELMANGITFTINGMKGVAVANDDFESVKDSNYNILAVVIDQAGYVRLGSASGPYVIDGEGNYITDEEIADKSVYETTDVAPVP